MSDLEKEKDFYQRLKEELNQTSKWPSDYLYKFIIPNKKEKIEQLENIFKNSEAQITTKESSNGKYISYSININLDSPEAVIEYYKQVGSIEGIISL